MHSLRSRLFVIGCLALFPSLALAKTDLAKLVKSVQPAVVTVTAFRMVVAERSPKPPGYLYTRKDLESAHGKPITQGTGFFIGGNGELITSYHVLKGADRVEITTFDGETYEVDTVIGENESMDLIKLRAKIPPDTYRSVRVIKRIPNVAEHILVIGTPIGFEQTVADGVVSAIRKLKPEDENDGREILQISAPLSPGSSGSPVFNLRGQVVGVASFRFTKGQNINFAIPGKYVFEMEWEKSFETWSKQWKRGRE